MATIIGSLRPEAAKGEQTVLNLLNALPDECLVWPELPVYERYPDFVVLHPKLGVAVLEVKDWVEITRANPDAVVVRTRAGDDRSEPNPVRQARDKAIAIANRLEQEPRLLNSFGPHQGKLRVPWAYAVAFPNMTAMLLDMLGPVIDSAYRFCSDDLTPSDFEYRLRNLDWKYQADLSSGDVQAIRATLYGG